MFIGVKFAITTEHPSLLEWYTPMACQIGFQAWPFRDRVVQSQHTRQLRQFPVGDNRNRETQSLDQLRQGETSIGDDAPKRVIRTRGVEIGTCQAIA